MLLLGELIQAFQKRLCETCALRDGQLQGFGFQLGKVHAGIVPRGSEAAQARCPIGEEDAATTAMADVGWRGARPERPERAWTRLAKLRSVASRGPAPLPLPGLAELPAGAVREEVAAGCAGAQRAGGAAPARAYSWTAA